MPLPIEDYALIGNCHTAALVGKDGSIDWLCFPRFDAGACFAALLGTCENGRWLLSPTSEIIKVIRRYRDSTMVLETDFETAEGKVRIIDFMPRYNKRWDVVRIVEGLEGTVSMRMELVIRFDYGSIIPWVRRIDGVLLATAGPDTLELHTPIETRGENMRSVAEFSIKKGERIPFVLNYHPYYQLNEDTLDAEQSLVDTESRWHQWANKCSYKGKWQDAVIRSLVTLKALTYKPTGGIVAAPTTSLPEQKGGVRNWDYRYCWLRDATFTLNSLLLAGYQDEAEAWSDWLVRAVAGSPEDLQVLYSVTGLRRLDEYELDWLPGYNDASPVRIGNAAAKQFQLDIYGEIMDTFHVSRAAGIEPKHPAWRIQLALLRFLETNWQEPDEGIWEIRGPRLHFTHSKVMTWVAFDRAIKDAETYNLEGPVDKWKHIRDRIHNEVCERSFDKKQNSFVQSYESGYLDASLLLIPQVGFLPPDDPRVIGTIEAIGKYLLVDGLIKRYSTSTNVDALPPGEGVFLPCSFWYASSLVLIGRRQEAEALFERLLSLRNDLGLISEEYDTKEGHMLGNFPQALTHMALINTAKLLSISEEQVKLASQKGERPATVGNCD